LMDPIWSLKLRITADRPATRVTGCRYQISRYGKPISKQIWIVTMKWSDGVKRGVNINGR